MEEKVQGSALNRLGELYAWGFLRPGAHFPARIGHPVVGLKFSRIRLSSITQVVRNCDCDHGAHANETTR
jgi:hypothetical protein